MWWLVVKVVDVDVHVAVDVCGNVVEVVVLVVDVGVVVGERGVGGDVVVEVVGVVVGVVLELQWSPRVHVDVAMVSVSCVWW